jgi:hypothetical protein
MKRILLLLSFTILFFNGAFSQGFTISGTQLIDANGNNFMMRGFAVHFAWNTNDVKNNIVNFRTKANANCLRIVLNTTTNDAEWKNFVTACIANKMIPMVELHDQTCGTTSEGLANMANWWVSKKAFLTSPEISRYILINIANEWGDWNMAQNSPASWRDAYINAVSIMRRGGIKTTLVIDAPDCGQDINNGTTLKMYAKDVFDSDSLKNCLFSVHLYGEWETSGGSRPSNLPSIKEAGIPFIVGEFAASVNDTSVMNTCQRNGIGWLAWSWKGNSDPTYTDMSVDWAGNNLSLWGNTAINGINGIKQTGHMASVFIGDSGCAPTKIIPEIQVNEGDWVQSANVSVNLGESVVIGPQPTADGSWKWLGPEGFTETTREVTLSNIQPVQGGYYIASYTNAANCISDTAIKINVIAYPAEESEIDSGSTYKIISKYSGKALDVSNSSMDDGALIMQMEPDESLSQEWIISKISNGYWKIISANSGKSLNVTDAETKVGVPIEQMTYSAVNSMKWQLVKDGDGYFQIKNFKSKLCLDIFSASVANEAQIVQWTSGADDNQKFSLVKLKGPDALKETEKDATDLVYPNPSNGGNIIISSEIASEGSELRIFDSQGKQVYNAPITGEESEINTGLAKGMYIVKLQSGENSYIQKLLIQ